jgi:hypothetical protein
MVAHRVSADYKFGNIRMKTKEYLNHSKLVTTLGAAIILSTPRPRERQPP